MPRKRPHLFGQDPPRNVLPRFIRDGRPEMSAAEQAAWRTLKPHLHRFVQRRRGVIGATVGAGAAAAASWGSSKISDYFKVTRSGRSYAPVDPPALRGSVEDMPADTVMSTHGDACDAVDIPFGRDGENVAQQKAAAAALWNRAPRIYDDEIIVRMPFIIPLESTASGTGMLYTANTNLAAAGPPIVPNVNYYNGGSLVLNDIFSPYASNTALKPHGYGWYSQLYNYYQVLECRWNIRISKLCPNINENTGTKNYPLAVFCTVGDNTNPVFNNDRACWEVGHNNGASKSLIVHGPRWISNDYARSPDSTGGSEDFGGSWTPAMFDDLQTNITFQPMTAVGAQPNWKNYLNLGFINYNPTASAAASLWVVNVHYEYLVHFKKINLTKYGNLN
jgi:hypothetical protein